MCLSMALNAQQHAQVVLHLLLPGLSEPGVKLANGRRLRYKLTGVLLLSSCCHLPAAPASEGRQRTSMRPEGAHACGMHAVQACAI